MWQSVLPVPTQSLPRTLHRNNEALEQVCILEGLQQRLSPPGLSAAWPRHAEAHILC